MQLRRPAAALLTLVAFAAAGPSASAETPLELPRSIVVVDAGVDPAALAAELGLTPTFVYRHALDGFAAPLPAALAQALAADQRVAFVEADRTFTATAELPTGVNRIDADRLAAAGIGTGRAVNVDVAVLDTGVDAAHRDLTVATRTNCMASLLGGGGCRPGGTDDNGHGTHVSGTIAAKDNGLDVVGVVPGARIHAVKVLGGLLGSGSTSEIIAGIDYVTANAATIEVANMSLGGKFTSTALNNALARSSDAGVVYAVAAGNDSADEAPYSPAGHPDVITVSAVSDSDGAPGGRGPAVSGNADDTFASYSNFGAGVDIAAPGTGIVSTRNGGGTTALSGTSMASPHVAGAAALWIASRGVARTGARGEQVLGGILSSWSTAQTSPCGFRGGRTAEPMLLLVPCGT